MRRAEAFGVGMTALCGGALAVNLLLVAGLLTVLGVNGLSHFWQPPLLWVELEDGSRLLGEPHGRRSTPDAVPGAEPGERILLRVGRRDAGGSALRWIVEDRIASRAFPSEAVVVEHRERGRLYGTMLELRRRDQVLAVGPRQVWRAFGPLHNQKLAEFAAVRRLERREVGEVERRLERLRLARRGLELARLADGERRERERRIDREAAKARSQLEALSRRLLAMRSELLADKLVLATAGQRREEIAVGRIVRAVRPNEMGPAAKLLLCGARAWEFVSEGPRAANTAGGIFPAILGTAALVFVMSLAVAPLGVLAALYLREYARPGRLVRLVRLAVNGLAGVPPIVFGMFGLGLFVHMVGGTIDRLFYPEALPAPTFGTGGLLWASLTLALLTVPMVIVATEEGLTAVPRSVREASLALGATRFETTRRVIIPAAAPGILTGLLLATARAAGEVAPLLVLGVASLGPELPVDRHVPFVHLEREFTHLGLHIYEVGFEGPVEAVRPIVFATALLLIVVVTVMNLIAVAVRNHLRRRYASNGGSGYP